MSINIESPGDAGPQLTAALVSLLAGSVGIPLAVSLFTSSGTWNRASGAKRAIIIGVGSGGSSGGVGSTTGSACSGGGSAGESRIGVFDISSVSSASVVIGAPGAAPSAGNNNGNNGADCTFGALMTCKPGKGGGGVAGGSGTLGTMGASHDNGTGGTQLPAAPPYISSFATTFNTAGTPVMHGGRSWFGGQLATELSANFTTTGLPAAASGYGNGGMPVPKGGGTTPIAGVAGAAGCFLIVEFG